MKHNQFVQSVKFVVEPFSFNKFSERDFLQYCLGATLYMPGTKNILSKILNKNLSGLSSLVMCFEDAIQEEDLSKAQNNVLVHLETLSKAIIAGEITFDNIPLIFLRVRNPNQFKEFSMKLSKDQANVLSGFVFPKFDSINGKDYLEILNSINQKLDVKLYAMPILEGKKIAFQETRIEELNNVLTILRPCKELILNLRVGGTDFSSLFGVRRGINYSIYDILPIRDCLSDILNFFSRVEEGFTISGPVWEYFLAYKDDNLDNILKSKDIHSFLLTRTPIINEAIDGLLREVVLDKANGFVGKTIIHPSHTKYVNAMQSVTKEEYDDAKQIFETAGGVIKSRKENKMNEINPHRNWAKMILNRAKAYGVIESEADYLRLILE